MPPRENQAAWNLVGNSFVGGVTLSGSDPGMNTVYTTASNVGG